MSFSSKIIKIYNIFIDFVFASILIFLVLGLSVGVFQLFFSVKALLSLSGITGQYIDFISDVLTIYILIELTRSLVEYFESHRLKMVPILDAAIVFVVREILIALFKNKIEVEQLYSLTAVAFVVAIIRLGTTVVESKFGSKE